MELLRRLRSQLAAEGGFVFLVLGPFGGEIIHGSPLFDELFCLSG